jgi:thioredoxin-related protein
MSFLKSLLSVSIICCTPIFPSNDSSKINAIQADNNFLLWQEDFDIAQEIAMKEQRPLFVLFTGSDWCKNCLILEEQILSHASFIEKVKERFIFVKIDYPLKRKLSQSVIQKNQKLKEIFNVSGFPTAVICLTTGEKLFFAGRFPIEPKECAELFIKELDKAYDLSHALIEFDQKKEAFTVRNLEELYKKAKLLGKTNEAAMIMKVGLEKEEDNAFFLQEKFRFLLDEGKLEDGETLAVKEKLAIQDFDNTKGHNLYMALCEFQCLSKSCPDPKKVSAPLSRYLKDFGTIDNENNWRVELMLAHYHSSIKEKEKALSFFKEALRNAPQCLKADIEADVAKLDLNN